MMLWAGSMSLFEVSHYVPSKPLYEQGFILLPHLVELSYSILSGLDIGPLYATFVISVLHLIGSAILSIGGIYHSIVADSVLEGGPYSSIFNINFTDRYRMSSILGGLFHIVSRPSNYLVRAYLWAPEAYLSYSLAALSLSGFIAATYSWYNNTAYPSFWASPNHKCVCTFPRHQLI